MNGNWIGDQIKSGLTQGWLKVASGYECSIVSPIRYSFQAVSRVTGPYGAYAALGGMAIGIFYLGHRIWHMKMEPHVELRQGKAVVIERGPKSGLLQLMLRIVGLFEIVLAAAITGGLVAVAGGSTPLSIGIMGGTAIVGILV